MENTCHRCHRPVLFPVTQHKGPCDTGITAYVVHQSYGCNSGCCGHQAFLLDVNGDIVDSDFSFSHPYGAPIEEFIRNNIHDQWPWATINYEACEVIDD